MLFARQQLSESDLDYGGPNIPSLFSQSVLLQGVSAGNFVRLESLLRLLLSGFILKGDFLLRSFLLCRRDLH